MVGGLIAMNLNDMDIDRIDIRLGIADGAVHWGAVGIAFQPAAGLGCLSG